MRFARFVADGTPNHGLFGMLMDEYTIRVVGDDTQTGPTYNVQDISRWLPPITPPNVICVGKNYADHADEFGGEAPAEPVLFLKPTTALNSHREPIYLPQQHADEVDFEAELAIVIGELAQNVKREDAFDYILGYTCANDVSARDCQLRLDQQWARGKSFDSFCPVGPYLVNDIDPSNLKIELRLNGQPMQQANTSQMIHDVPALVEYISHNMTLLPGTVILTGTPAGVGMARTPPRYLREGDMIEVEIEGVGVLENTVAVR